MKIGVIIPHFPSQTHTFFWREICEIESRGVSVAVFSTSKPPDAELCHDWTEAAMTRTTRLNVGFWSICFSVLGTLVARPVPCLKSLGSVFAADWDGIGERIRAVAAWVLGLRLSVLARRSGITHLHAHSASLAAVVARVASEVSGLGCSITLHGPLTHYGGGQAWKWSGFSFAIVVSRNVIEDIPPALLALPADGVHVSPMGVDLKRFDGRNRRSADDTRAEFQIISCGRLHIAKGHQDVIRAVGILRDRGRHVKLRILGAGSYRRKLEELIDALGLNRQVELAGPCGELEVRDVLADSDAFVLASHNEAIGVATMEAMAMALPVVVADVGGVGELVDSDVGILVEKENFLQIAEAIDMLISSPRLRRELGNAGRQRILEGFGSERSAGVLIDLAGMPSNCRLAKDVGK